VLHRRDEKIGQQQSMTALVLFTELTQHHYTVLLWLPRPELARFYGALSTKHVVADDYYEVQP